ncbi:MAG: polymerase [Aquabacterium sp.]|nr:MAG: polymerase [Aquabacterium sp.]
MSTPDVGTSHPVSAAVALSPAGWTWALLAIAAPTLIAAHDPPSVTFYNQALAVLGWGLWLAWMGRAPGGLDTPATPRAQAGHWALTGMLAVLAAAAFGSGVFGTLPAGLSLMGGGMSLAALLAFHSGWRQGRSVTRDGIAELFFGALAVAGGLGLLLAAVQVFMPSWADGTFIASPNMAGRAVGNLRQPNHFSTLLVFAAAGLAWLGARRRLRPGVAALGVALCIGGIVLTASRTGMVAMVFLTAWGVLDRRLPRTLRVTLVAAPLLYGAWWGGMWLLAHADRTVAFAGETRLHDSSDISSSRFKIWANVLSLIQQHPWWGVGYGEFNLAWTLTPFPNRPAAFFDHTHNVVLQWAVELGLPAAIVLSVLALWGWWSLVRPGSEGERQTGEPATVGAAAVIVTTAGLHSLLEYPLWYSYFLLPTAFAWGLGLAARQGVARDDRAARPRWCLAGGVVMALMAIWCALDYQAAANIYAPRPGASSLERRIAFAKQMPWWGYQADYAEVTVVDKSEPSAPPQAFRRTLHNLLDARLMMAYARSLAEHGEIDKARFVVARLKEFKNASAKTFLAACDAPPVPGQEAPFQCAPPQRHYAWRELLP